VYVADATMTDEMHGLSAQGPGQIGALASSSGPVAARTNAEVVPQRVLDLAPEVTVDAPAVFLTFALDRAHLPTQVWLMVRSEAPCPGDTAIGLDLDEEQRITAERRYASIASMRKCVDPVAAPQGWWSGRELPLPFSERITASLETAPGAVEIRNGWPPSDAAVHWAFGQFTAAGLPAPVVSTLTFDPFDERCRDAPGHAEWSGGTTEVLICFDSSQIGPGTGDDWAMKSDQTRLLLHEIGHAWLINHTDDVTRAAFLAELGLDNWNDKGRPWRERGVEWAAESLARGLKGAPSSSLALGRPDCGVLAEGYRILTGAEPLTSCTGGAAG
jgi:hypothetical protein